MRTMLVIQNETAVPAELRQIIDAGSTSVEQVPPGAVLRADATDRVLMWEPGLLRIGERRLRWPDDEDEIRLLLQTAG